MIEFTIVDYWRYQSKFLRSHLLNDLKENYRLEITHQYHDKIFKELLDNKEEFINFIKRFTQYKTVELEQDKIEKYNRKFITSSFTTKESDIIYKIKARNIFIIIEHQSTIDYKMPERITQYCVELIRSIKKENKTKQSLYPLICPIVLYTGNKRWDAPLSLTQIQEKYYGFEPLNYPKYNLIDMNQYSKEELLEEKTAIAKAMLFEKMQTKEEMKEILEILTKKKLTEQEHKYLQIILSYSNDVKEKLDQEEILAYQEILKNKGEVSMTNFERLLIELIEEKHEKRRIMKEEAQKEGIQEGIQEGLKKGIKQALQEVINNMLKMKLSDQIIMQATQVKKEELQKIKQKLKVC